MVHSDYVVIRSSGMCRSYCVRLVAVLVCFVLGMHASFGRLLLLNEYTKQVLWTRTEIIMWDYNPFWRLALVWVLPSRLGFWFQQVTFASRNSI